MKYFPIFHHERSETHLTQKITYLEHNMPQRRMKKLHSIFDRERGRGNYTDIVPSEFIVFVNANRLNRLLGWRCTEIK